MKNILALIIFSILSFTTIFAQNIPHANAVGPYGVQVNTFNGNLHFQRTDLIIPNTGLSIDISFSYNGFRDTVDYGYGKGWTFSYGMNYDTSGTGMVVEKPDGRVDFFEKNGSIFKSPEGIFDTWEDLGGERYVLTTKYGMQYHFENSDHKKLTKLADSNGNTIELTYNANGFPIQIQDQSNRSVSLAWSGTHLSMISDANFSGQRSINFTYDADSHLMSAQDPEGGVMQYGYADDLLVNMTNELGDILEIKYDESGRVIDLDNCLTAMKIQYGDNRTYAVEKNDSGDRMTTFVYDEEGMLQSKVGNCCGFNTQYNYDDNANVNQLTDANGNNFSANHDNLGNALVTTDPFSNSQNFSFGSKNRISSFKDKKGNASSFSYDANGNLKNINQPEGVQLGFNYDTKGNLTILTDGNGNQTQMTYNANNDVTSVVPTIPNTGETLEYDGVGNLLKSTDGNNNAVSYSYDKLNRLKEVRDALTNKIAFGYDAAGNLIQETDANGHQKEFGYDGNHRLEIVETPSGTTRYEYDQSDNLTAIVDANGHQSTYTYNVRNLLISETDAEGNTTSYSYDGNGNILSKRDANGNLTNYKYDALNRLTEKSYDGNTDTYSYDANGNLIFCANNGISMSFTYDGLNRLLSKTVLNWNQTIAYEYDGAGNRTKMVDPDGGETIYQYDANNRLVNLTNPNNETTEFIYDNGSRLTEQRHANGTITTYAYDVANRLEVLENKKSDGSIIASYNYEYDRNGNRTEITGNENGSNSVKNYTYDGDNRLVAVSGAQNESYTFDNAGNRKTYAGLNYTYDNADRLQSVGSTNYAFDNNGNLIQKTEGSEITIYEYDGENRLIKVAKNGVAAEFFYDPFGNRIGKTIDGEHTRFLLDGDNVLMELNPNNVVQARYTAGLALDSWISMERSNASYFYHTDGLGSIAALTNGSGVIENNYQYGTYGEHLGGSQSVENPYRYTGREYEEAIDLYYYRTRFYDAEIGRFVTKDKFEGFQKSPLSQNNYAYVLNNPVNFNDPSGKFAWIPFLVGAWVIGSSAGTSAGLQYIENGGFECFDYSKFFIETGIGIGLGSYSTLYNGKKTYDASRGIAGLKLLQKHKQKAVDAARKALNKNGSRANTIRLRKADSELLDVTLEFGKTSNRRGTDITTGIAGLGYESYSFYSTFSAEENNCNKSEGAQGPPPPLPKLPPVTDDKNTICVPIIRSFDPNEIIAPAGYGYQKWVAQDATLPYTILFENDPVFATAAAQRVTIEHTLDTDLNRATFRLGSFGFGSYFFNVPDDVSYYNTQLDLTDSLGILLQVTAGLDYNNNRAFWVMESRDPATGLATTLPADAGFLPVNDTITHVGEGFVNFTVKPSLFSETGDTIRAQASIIFDDNAPIETNIDFNIIDADIPKSAITSDDADNGIHNLKWSGTDTIAGKVGSGIASYSLYVSTNDGAFLPLINNLTAREYEFSGSPDSSYCFFVRAVDNVQNRENLKLNCEPACMNVSITEIIASSGGNEGSIELDVTGNDGTITYEWSHDASLNSNIATELAPGDYQVTISDDSGCVIFSVFTIEILSSTVELSKEPVFIHNLYPVPTSTELIIEFTGKEEVVFLEVYDITGKKIFQQTVEILPNELSQFTLNTSDYASGTYLVRLQSRSGRVSGMFVKQ